MDRIVKEAERGVAGLTGTKDKHAGEKLQKDWGFVLKEYERYKAQVSALISENQLLITVDTQIAKVQDQYMAQVSVATPDALSRLEINTPHKVLNAIVESSYKSMQIIEPWRQARLVSCI